MNTPMIRLEVTGTEMNLRALIMNPKVKSDKLTLKTSPNSNVATLVYKDYFEASLKSEQQFVCSFMSLPASTMNNFSITIFFKGLSFKESLKLFPELYKHNTIMCQFENEISIGNECSDETFFKRSYSSDLEVIEVLCTFIEIIA